MERTHISRPYEVLYSIVAKLVPVASRLPFVVIGDSSLHAAIKHGPSDMIVESESVRAVDVVIHAPLATQ